MLIKNQQFLHMIKTEIHTINAGFDEKQYVRYQLLGAKISTRVHCCKDGSDFEMIEKFYSRLLPVTFRDWACGKV
ncbi:MAG TPA: hypothetical protein VMV48_00245 [Gallionellaceae bacterium]|nr:hypothetical protein [Gallionellaceae bacterium]